MGFNAITEDATLRVLEWGSAPLRAAGAGETAYVGTIDEASQSVIDAEGPNHTKIVGLAFTAMSAGEKAAVDEALADAQASQMSSEMVNYAQAIANVASVVSVGGVLTFDCLEANEFSVALHENITSIVFVNGPANGKGLAMRVVFIQDATPRTLPASWPDVDWWVPQAGAPSMPAGAGKSLLATVYSQNGSQTIGTWAAEP